MLGAAGTSLLALGFQCSRFTSEPEAPEQNIRVEADQSSLFLSNAWFLQMNFIDQLYQFIEPPIMGWGTEKQNAFAMRQ